MTSQYDVCRKDQVKNRLSAMVWNLRKKSNRFRLFRVPASSYTPQVKYLGLAAPRLGISCIENDAFAPVVLQIGGLRVN